MAIGSVGLQTAIWNNNAKSVLLLAGFPLLLLIMLFAFFSANAYFSTPAAEQAGFSFFDAGVKGLVQYGHVAFLAAGAWFLVSFFFHQKMVNFATGAKPITRAENPRIYNLLENLCISRGITMPQFQIIETPALNAFASGISEKNYTITLTTGIINALDDEELEAVIAHELTHIINRDVRLLIISVVFVGMISFLCDMLWRNMRFASFGNSRDKKGAGFQILIAAVILALGYFFSILIRFALSRRREFMADAGAVELTKNPDAMIRALQKISGHSKIEGVTGDFREMMIENDTSEFVSFFATHPPIRARINALISFGGQVSELPQEPLQPKNPEDLWR